MLNVKDWSEEQVGDPVSLLGMTPGGLWPHLLTRAMTVVLLAEDSVVVLVVVVLLVAVVAVDLKHADDKIWEYKKNTSTFFI
jgi:hypothetical protein